MTPVIARHPSSLELQPRSVDLPPVTAPWPVLDGRELPVGPGPVRLVRWRDTLLLVNAPTGVRVVRREGVTPICQLDGRVVYAHPTLDGPPLLQDGDGQLYRWDPEHASQPPTPIGRRVGSPTETAILGLAGGDVLVQRPRGGAFRALLGLGGRDATIERIDPGTGEIWREAGKTQLALPGLDGATYTADIGGATIVCRARDGAVVWRQTLAGGVGELLAMVDDRLWLWTTSRSLVGLDAATGLPQPAVELAGFVAPAGVVDQHGRLHVWNGSRYAVTDLARPGAQPTRAEPTRARGTPIRHGYGQSAWVTHDGRVVACDSHGGVFVLRPGAGDEVAVLRPPPGRLLLDLHVLEGVVYLLTEDREFVMLRAP